MKILVLPRENFISMKSSETLSRMQPVPGIKSQIESLDLPENDINNINHGHAMLDISKSMYTLSLNLLWAFEVIEQPAVNTFNWVAVSVDTSRLLICTLWISVSSSRSRTNQNHVFLVSYWLNLLLFPVSSCDWQGSRFKNWYHTSCSLKSTEMPVVFCVMKQLYYPRSCNIQSYSFLRGDR